MFVHCEIFSSRSTFLKFGWNKQIKISFDITGAHVDSQQMYFRGKENNMQDNTQIPHMDNFLQQNHYFRQNKIPPLKHFTTMERYAEATAFNTLNSLLTVYKISK